jgi:uncharacterized membrane protein
MSDSRQTAPPRELVAKNAEAIAAVRARADKRLDRHQKSVELATAALGRPLSIFVVIALVSLWIAFNVSMKALGKAPIDPPPFFWLQGAVALGALLTSLMVLTTQNRQRRHAEERAHLDLQVNLAAEQKTAKLIALVEELRRDLPNVPNRRDALAESMARAVDPHAALTALEQTFEAPGDDEPRPSARPSQNLGRG